jgi:putative peptidoglycan lipid II flippase
MPSRALPPDGKAVSAIPASSLDPETPGEVSLESESTSASAEPVPGRGIGQGVAAQTAILTSIQFVSPAIALLAEIVLAWRFGASGVVDAYRVTVLLLIYGQQLFVTSILPFVLVPIFAECRAKHAEQEAWHVADSVGWLLLVFGGCIAGILFCFPELVAGVVAPGVTANVRTTAIFLIRWCGLGFIPLCWTGAACGILYAYDTFYVAPVAQLASNAMLVLAIACGAPKLGATSLAVGILAGATTSTLIYSVSVSVLRRRFGPERRVGIHFRSVQSAWRLAAPLVGSVLTGQSTSVVVNRVLSRLPIGTLAAFGYAWKMSSLVQLLPSALSTVMFPKFSAAWYSGGREEFAASCIRALRATTYFAMLMTALSWALRRPLMVLFFERGAFTASNAATAGALFGLLVLNGPAVAVVTSLGRAFYAVQETRIPVLLDVTSNILALVFIPLLAARFGGPGAAFAYMLLPWAVAVGLIMSFRRRFGSFPVLELGGFAAVTLLVAAFSGWLGSGIGQFAGGLVEKRVLVAAVTVGCGGAVAAATYFLGTLLLRLPEAAACSRFLLRVLGSPFRTELTNVSVLPELEES